MTLRGIARLWATLFAALGITCAGIRPALAGAATNSVAATHGELVARLDRQEGDAAVAALLDARFEHAAIARAMLGDEGATLGEDERARFTALSRQLIQAVYLPYLRGALSHDVEYQGERVRPADVTVTLLAREKAAQRNDPLEIALVMVPRDGTWKVVDVVVEQVSLTASYRRQIAKILHKDGFEALVARMEAKIAKRAGSAARVAPAEPVEDEATEPEAPPARDRAARREEASAPSSGGRLLGVGGTVLALGLLVSWLCYGRAARSRG